jgi:membrane-bound metal-dependent hydrolase YbcI (DUF457 family)
MKGFTHFTVGAAIATCFPQAVDMALNQTSFILVLGGIFGILPDTLDFKLAMFIERNDYVIDPAEKEYLKDPMDMNSIDPQKIADKMAKAIDQAWVTGKMVKLQLHTVQMGGDLWRHYEVSYDTVNNEVVVEIGSIVTLSQVPIEVPGLEFKGERIGRAKTTYNILQTQSRPSRIDIFNGPSFGYLRKGDEGVEVVFLPWHRQWSHSPLMGIALGLTGGLLMSWVTRSFYTGAIYGLIMALGFISHILSDLTGFMGANLLWPFTRKRTEGFQFLKASDPIANFLMVWASALLIVWNLNRYAPEPAFEFYGIEYFIYFLFIPAGLLVALAKRFGEKKKKEDASRIKAEEEAAFGEEEFSSDSR